MFTIPTQFVHRDEIKHTLIGQFSKSAMHPLSGLIFAAALLTVTGTELEVGELRKLPRDLPPHYEQSVCSGGVGFYRDPYDCHQYVRCVQDPTDGRTNVFLGKCRPGLVFDENISSCNWPALAAPCRNAEPPQRFRPVGFSDNAITASGNRQQGKPQFVQESAEKAFQETEIHGKIQESFEEPPHNSKSATVDRNQVYQQSNVRQQNPKPVRQQVQEHRRRPVEKPQHTPQQVREPVIQEQFERVQKPNVQKQEIESQKKEPEFHQEPEQVREPVVEENFEEVQRPSLQQVQEPDIQQSEQVREPLIQESEQVREPTVQQKVREPVIQQKVREPVIQQKVREPVIQQKVREPVIQQKVREPVIQQKVREPVIQQSQKVREPVSIGKQPQDSPTWQESDEQEKILQPEFEDNVQQLQGDSGRIKEPVQSGIFQEVSGEEVRQTSSSSVKNPPLKQPQVNKLYEGNQLHRPTISSNRRRPAQPLSASLDYPILCKREGFFRHPKDCTRFVKCEKTEQNSFQVNFFQCSSDHIFDEAVNHCVYSKGDPCISRRSKRQAESESLQCNDEGFFRHPGDCRSFYRCVKGVSGLFDTYLFSCPDTLVFDEEYATCNWPDKAAACDTQRPAPQPSESPIRIVQRTTVGSPIRIVQRTTVGSPIRIAQRTTTRPKSDTFNPNPFTSSKQKVTSKPKSPPQSSARDKQACNSPGFYRNDEDCTKFYKCVQRGNYFVQYELSCPNNFAYDESASRCVSQQYSNVCKKKYTPSPPRTYQDDKPATESGTFSEQPQGDQIECERAGYFRNPQDCNQFYRCVDFSGEGKEFVKYDFSCPEGLVFNEERSVCTWPDPSKPCDSSRGSTGGGGDRETEQDGEPNDTEQDGEPNDTDNELSSEAPEETTPSRRPTRRPTTQSGRRPTTASTTVQQTEESESGQGEDSEEPEEGGPGPVEESGRPVSESGCSQEGFFRNPEDCNKFYRCVNFGAGREYVRYDFTCGEGLVFDEANSVCNWPAASAPCDASAGSGGEEGEDQPDDNEQPDSSSTMRPTQGGRRPTSETQRPNTQASTTPRGRGTTSTPRTTTSGGQGPSTNGRPRQSTTGRPGQSTTGRPGQSTTGRPGQSTTGRPRQSTTTMRPNDQTTTSSSTTTNDSGSNQNSGECSEAGFFRNPEDCNKFYRCVDYNGDGAEFVKYDFACPEGLTFDEKNSVCNWPEASAPCEGGSEKDGGDSTADTDVSSTSSTTPRPTRQSTTTRRPTTTQRTTTQRSTTQRTTTQRATTQRTTTQRATTQRTTIQSATTQRATTQRATTQRATTQRATTQRATTRRTTTRRSTTQGTTTQRTTTQRPTQRTTTQRTTSTASPTQSTATAEDSTNEDSTSGEDGNSSGGECTEAGFFRNPDDCGKFYRCVDFNGDGQQFVRYDFDCPEGLTFDEVNSVCNWPDQSPSCDSASTDGNGESSVTTSAQQTSTQSGTTTTQATVSSTKSDEESSTAGTTSQTDEPTPASSTGCSEEGFYRCPEDCNKFYRCVEDNNRGNFVRYNFTCPEGLIFDEQNKKCDYPSDELTCENGTSTSSESTQSESTTTASSITTTSTVTTDSSSSTTGDASTCTEEGYFRNPEDCSKYYRCLDEGNGTFTREDFACADDEVFDEEMRYCNRRELDESCNQGTTTPQTQGTTQAEESVTDSSRRDCTEQGFFRCPDDCNKFYRCVENEEGGGLKRYNFTCPEGLIFDENNKRCDFPSEQLTCDTESSTTSSSSDATTPASGTTSPETSETSSTGSSSECTEEGYFRDPNDCSKYYRCLDEGDGTFTREDFSCAEGEVFDEEMRYCNREELATSCNQTSTESGGTTGTTNADSSSTPGSPTDASSTQSSESTTSNPTEGTTQRGDQSGDCREEGFRRDPEDCSKFQRCVDFEGNGQSFTRYDFECPEGLVFDEENDVCNWPSSVPNCESSGRDNSSSTTERNDNSSTTTGGDSSTSVTDQASTDSSTAATTASDQSTAGSTDEGSSSTGSDQTTADGSTSGTTGGGSSIDCTEEGFFRNPDDCTKFYRCVDFAGTGESYVRYDFECPRDLVFDEVNQVCNWASQTPACEGSPRNDSATTTTSGDGSTTVSDGSTMAGDSSMTTAGDGSTTTAQDGSTTAGDGSTTAAGTTVTGGDFQCEEEGFFRDSVDCRKYYECKRDGGQLVKIECECPEGQVFDVDGWYCNARELAPPCDGDAPFRCEGEGFFRDPEDCSRYFRCAREGDRLEETRFECPNGTVFDEEGRYCNAPELAPSCDNSTATTAQESVSTTSSGSSSSNGEDSTGSTATTAPSSTTAGSNDSCTEEGFFRESEDCSKYHSCTRNQDSGELERTDFECKDGRVFDEAGNYCNEPELTEGPCGNAGPATGATGEDGTTTPTESSTPSSTTTTSGDDDRTTTNGDRTRGGGGACTEAGFFRNPDDCGKFYRCVDFAGTGLSFVRFDFDCPDGLHFDEVNSVCNWPTMTPRCE
ncbi:hypothetical protein JTE90_014977 [Oedothorax gibbosus]|uniref:Chitin-binding type-2 domain-containing protein n=1 Tax=Oedothorax gibbosus TaxID=931172 RepID=A0AAV6UWQ9_9ARAC|nr:hypothetical protein JTE90_014977 [Oedothorax gibbosus]